MTIDNHLQKQVRISFRMKIIPHKFQDSTDTSAIGIQAIAHIQTLVAGEWVNGATMSSPGEWGVDKNASNQKHQAAFERQKTGLLDILASIRAFDFEEH
jgi:hypothetical protein